MTLSPTKRRAEQLDAALEHGIRTDDPELAPLAALATALADLPQPTGPSAEFRTALRQRLVAVATVQGVGEAAPASTRLREATSTWRFQRRVAGLAAGAAAVTAVAGVSVGASRSLPGDAFYGLKRAAETAQLDLTFGQEAKGKRHLEFAQTRLAEAKALAGEVAALPAIPAAGQWTAAGSAPSADTSAIVSTLQDMDNETRAGAHDLYAAYRDSGSSEPLRVLNAFTQQQYSQLLQLLPELPAAARPVAKSSLSLLAIVRKTAVQIEQPALSPHQTHSSGGTTRPTSSPKTHVHTTPTPSTGSSAPPAGGTSSSSSPSSSPKSKSGTPTVPTVPPLPTSLPVPTSIPTLVPVPNVTSPLLGG